MVVQMREALPDGPAAIDHADEKTFLGLITADNRRQV